MIVHSVVSQLTMFTKPLLSLLISIAIDDARFVTNAVFVIEQLKGLPIRNCPLDHRLNMSMLSKMNTELEFAWPNWPKKEFRFMSALEQEWSKYASCFMDFMKTKNVWMNEKDFFQQVISWYKEFQFAKKLKMYRIIPGSTIFIDRLYHALRATTGQKDKPRIDCIVKKNQEGKNEVRLQKVALCFNITSLEPTDCGNLYGGSRGACPKFFEITYPYPLPKTSNVSRASVIFNVIYLKHFHQSFALLNVIMLLVLIICFIAYLNVK